MVASMEDQVVVVVVYWPLNWFFLAFDLMMMMAVDVVVKPAEAEIMVV